MKIQSYQIIKNLRNKMNAFFLEFHEGYNAFTLRHTHTPTHMHMLLISNDCTDFLKPH